MISTSKGTFARGVHPEEWKELSAEAAIEVLPAPKEVRVALLQHIQPDFAESHFLRETVWPHSGAPLLAERQKAPVLRTTA